MDIIITGATSFLGKSLVNLYLKKGDHVYAIGRRMNNPFPKEVDYISLDIKDYSQISNRVRHCDVFINLAWMGTSHEDRLNPELQESNVKYSLEAIFEAKKLGCKVFIESGSQAEYGIRESSTAEIDTCNPVSEYGKAKLKLQREASKLCTELGMSYIHTRIFSLIGENDHDWTLVMYAISKMKKNEELLLTKCTQSWNFLYVEDAATMIYNIGNHFVSSPVPVQEIFNIASDDTRPLKDFVNEIMSMIDTKSHIRFGAIDSSRTVALIPDITKYINTIGVIQFTPFKTIIEKIINK